MKTLKIMICALFVVCGGLLFAGCGTKNKNFDVTKIIVNEFTEYTYDGKPHAVTVSYSDTNAKVTYALKEDKNNFKSINDLGLVDVGTYNIYYRLSAKGYNTYTSEGTLELTIVPRTLNIYVEDQVLMKSELDHNFTIGYATEGTIEGDETGLEYAFGDDYDPETAEYDDVYDITWSVENKNYVVNAPNAKAYIKDYVSLNDAQGDFKAYYTNVQTAIDNAQDGETVVLNNNIVVKNAINVNKSITIDGQSNFQLIASATIGRTEYQDKKVSSIFSVTSSDVELILKNVIVNGGETARGVSMFGGKLVVDSATITNGKKTDAFVSGGVYLTNGATLEMKTGTIYGNNANDTNYTKYNADLFVDENSQATITGGTVGSSFINANEEVGTIVLNGGVMEKVYVEYDNQNGAELNFISGYIKNLYVSLKNDNGGCTGVSHELTAVQNTNYVGGRLIYADIDTDTEYSKDNFKYNIGATLISGLDYIFEDCTFTVPFSSTVKQVGLVFNNCTFATDEVSTQLYLTSANSIVIGNCTFAGDTTGGYAIDLNLYSTSCDKIVIANNIFNTTSAAIAVKARLGNTDYPTDDWAQNENEADGFIYAVVEIAGNDFNADNAVIEIGTTPQGGSTTANTSTGAFDVLVKENLDGVTIFNKFKIDDSTLDSEMVEKKIKISIAVNGVYDSTEN